jgi:hypothetical protein
MIRHIVFFRLKEFAEGAGRAENAAKAKAMLEGLMGRVPTLLSMSAGPNTVAGEYAWDFGLVAEFRDAEGLKQYVVHPEHRKVSEFMSKVRTERASADIEF